MSSRKLNDTECEASYSSQQFFAPDTSSVFEPGDTATILWYAGVIPEGTGSLSNITNFNLVLSAYRNESYVYNVLKNITVPFSGEAVQAPVYWSYIPDAPCPATQISYFWKIPSDLAPASRTDFDYVLLVEKIIDTGWALSESDPFRIVFPSPSPIPTPTSSASSSSPTHSASSASDGSTSTASGDSGSSSNSNLPNAEVSYGATGTLSGGAKAGIALGSIIGAVAVALGAWFFYRKRRRAYGGAPSRDTDEGPAVTDSLYVNGEGDGAFQGKVEIDGRQIPRESGGTPIHEMDDAYSRERRNTAVISEMSV
ncbi:hypothetical protein GGR55DRAFT_669891 [Xylaria sp. FL0064]|nr:hypothetical protein GGR55DRAFT_669891 [Xylaria sp. FL0064]